MLVEVFNLSVIYFFIDRTVVKGLSALLAFNCEGLVVVNNVYRLDFICESLDLLLNVVCGDLIMLKSCFDLNRAVFLFVWYPLGLPLKAFHLDCKNLTFQGYLVDLLTPWLDLPDDEQLGISEYLVNDVLLGLINVLDDFTCNFQEIVSRFRFAEIFVT